MAQGNPGNGHVMANPFASTDPQDTKAAQQRNFTAGPSGPVPGYNPFTSGALPLPALDLEARKHLVGPQD
jgi:hypothetical protein